MAGREPLGVVSPSEYEAVRQHVIDAVEAVPDDEGRPMGTRAFRPEELYAHGVFALSGAGLPTGRRDDASIYDVARRPCSGSSAYRHPSVSGDRC